MTPERLEQTQPLPAATPAPEEALLPMPTFVEADDEHVEAPPARGAPRLAMIVAIALAIGWTAFFALAHRDDLSGGADLRLWPALVAEWAVPMALIVLGLIVAQHGGAGRADRLGLAARALNDEAARLEERLMVVNRELSLAREFVSAQSRDLESLGRVATERLSESGGRLQDLVQVNGERIDAIASVSRVAIDNMEQLRAQLPVLASATRDMTNYIGSTGNSAQEHVRELQSALQRIGETGMANEQQVRSLRQAADGAVQEFAAHGERMAALSDLRFGALTQHSNSFRAEIDAHEAEALAALRAHATELHDQGQRIAASLRDAETQAIEQWRQSVSRMEGDVGAALVVIDNAERDAFAASHKRLLALSDDAERIDAIREEREHAFAEMLAARRRTAEQADEAALALLTRRLTELDAELIARGAAHQSQGAEIARQTGEIAERLGQSEATIAAIAVRSQHTRAELDDHLAALTTTLAGSRETLADAGTDVTALIASSERLLDLLNRAATQGREELPTVLGDGETRMDRIRAGIEQLLGTIDTAGQRGEDLSGRLRGGADDLHQRLLAITGLQDGVGHRSAAQVDALTGLRRQVEALDQESDALLARTRDEFAATMRGLSRELGEATAGAFDRAIRTGAANAAGRIEQAAAHAAGVGGEAAQQLRTEMDRVATLAESLEARVAAAQQRAESVIDRDFARHATVITDTLNSNAIDLTKALDRDVPDTAWAAYLRGDRGVFTRRAVRLLDNGQSRSVISLFENEPEFREKVSRYIHDFEAMLRELLTARDGDGLAVTVLSSDMGKLYVALAQAIERLRN